jgi:hypothetical protein
MGIRDRTVSIRPDIMTTLNRGFESDLTDAVLDDAEEQLRDSLGPEVERLARDRWEDYARRNDYDIEHIWKEADREVRREGDTVRLSIEWPGLTALFEFGVSPHTIEGNPVLAFQWEGPPEGTRPPGAPEQVVAQSVNWGSVTGGIPESRAIRDTWRELGRVIDRG